MEGQVYLSEEDVVRIAGFLDMTPADFEEKYVLRGPRLLRLRKPPTRQCLFHKDNRCSIHVVKPTQCRIFPYWPEMVESREEWDKTAKFCPGINTGPLVQIEDARTISQEMRTAYPSMYP